MAYLGFHGGQNYLWPLMLSQRGAEPGLARKISFGHRKKVGKHGLLNHVFLLFFYGKTDFFWPNGGHGAMALLNKPLDMRKILSDSKIPNI